MFHSLFSPHSHSQFPPSDHILRVFLSAFRHGLDLIAIEPAEEYVA
jgi:hypothetical protein